MKVLAIRGATTVSSNIKEEILNETTILMNRIINENKLDTDDIISICFTMTKDLDAVYPAVAVRENLGLVDIPLLNFEEKYIVGSLGKCIRILIYINSDKNKCDIKHIYLNKSEVLRPDLSK